MSSGNPDVGVWMQADTVTSNEVQNQILNKLKKLSSFPGILSEFKVFVGKLMGIEPTHPAIVPVYKLIVRKTVNYSPFEDTHQIKKRKPMRRLTKVEKSLKLFLEEMGICLKIPLSIRSTNTSDGNPGEEPHRTRVPLDKEWCEKERERILTTVKKEVGLNDGEFAIESSAKWKTLSSELKKRKSAKKTNSKKKARFKKNIEIIDLSELDEDHNKCLNIEPNKAAESHFEVIDITEQDDDIEVFELHEKNSNSALMEVHLEYNS